MELFIFQVTGVAMWLVLGIWELHETRISKIIYALTWITLIINLFKDAITTFLS